MGYLLFLIWRKLMKISLLGAGVVLGVALSGAAMAAESTDADAKSGAADSTVLTQAHDAKAVKKQKAETTKGGRPLSSSQAAPKTSN
ncbi:Secreted protein [Pseudomonas marginalis]